MIQQSELEPAYVLHSRPYRDTSLIVDLITEQLGRIAVVARGVRSKQQRLRQQLQPFLPLLISCRGKSELKTLTGVELAGQAMNFSGRVLFSGLYINGLMMRLLPVADPHPQVYHLYAESLAALREPGTLEPALRKFEFGLLDELGYGIPLDCEAETGEPLQPGAYYQFLPEQGFLRLGDGALLDDIPAAFLGEHLLAVSLGNYDNNEIRRAAKRLARLALKPYLGNNPLKSRELFSPQSST